MQLCEVQTTSSFVFSHRESLYETNDKRVRGERFINELHLLLSPAIERQMNKCKNFGRYVFVWGQQNDGN